MRWLNKNNKLVSHNDTKYRINWDRKAPSKGAQEVKDFLCQFCRNYIWFEEYRLPGCLLKVDFLSPTKKIAIEFQGAQHDKFVRLFHKNRTGYRKSFIRDLDKAEYLERNKYTLIEIFEKDLPLSRKFFMDYYNILI
jgi:hypothetical protein